MGLALKSKTKVAFEYTEDDMSAAWSLSPEDSGADLVRKLSSMLAFLRARTEPAVLPVLPVRTVSPAPITPVVPLHASPAAKIPGVIGESYEASLAKAEANGWELIQPGED